MKINLTKECDSNSFICGLVCEAFTETTFEALNNTFTPGPEGIECDAILSVNGIELDLQKFVDHWQKHVDTLIDERAHEIVRTKFDDIIKKLETVRDSVAPLSE